VQNFRTIGQGVFVGWVPENVMFPQESEVVLNTVLSANALHVMFQKTIDIPVTVTHLFEKLSEELGNSAEISSA
jgi:hypothetical protein